MVAVNGWSEEDGSTGHKVHEILVSKTGKNTRDCGLTVQQAKREDVAILSWSRLLVFALQVIIRERPCYRLASVSVTDLLLLPVDRVP